MTELERSLLEGVKRMDAVLTQEQINQGVKLEQLEQRLTALEELSPDLEGLCGELERTLAQLNAASIIISHR